MKRATFRFRRAFTLMEMLLAIAITGLLIGAASYLLVSLSTIWTLRTNEDSFEEHADGVTNFIQKALDESYGHYQPTLTSKNDASSSSDKPDSDDSADSSKSQQDKTSTTATDKDATTASGKDTTTASGNEKISGVWNNSGLTLEKIVSNDQAAAPSIHFRFFQFPPALGETNPPTEMGVEAWLGFDEKRGIYIVWKDVWSIQETVVTDERDLLRTSLLSSYVKRIDYIYWESDRKAWLEYPQVHDTNNVYTMPDFIRLTFDDHGRITTRLIHIPKSEMEMPLF
jgi:prepilin-type N-terminal cleavage/methylation domain-containing protein